ncbi:hypothetical protein [Pedobacter jejuensis]|uniref:Uncharacterized protein n=1 Tax=Pedobacter jejuensis TaxID=1268550 RepID=A0A3N0BMF6_9SPHI|nr:hypothetical protein [Pedobacter jejuensis]RNL49668.1 hypothetical protein D7004_19855 [Pedobacter jejuensis]
MKKHKQHINRLLAAIMLMVFAIALTPWNLLHKHQPIPVVKQEINCKHLSHVQAHADNCLICNAGFEKNYVHTHHLYKIFLSVKLFGQADPVLKSSYTEIKRTSLRGPPLA